MNEVRSRLSELRTSDLGPPLIALGLAVALFFLGGILRPGFANPGQAINIVRLAAFLGIISAGQTLVILAGGEGIDLSIGGVVTISAILVFRIVDGDNSMILPGLAIALAVGTLIGLTNGLGIVFAGLPPLVITLAMAGVVRGLILVVTEGELVGGAAPLMSQLISEPLIFGIPGVIIAWILLGIGIWALLQRTSYGKRLFAIGANRITARLSGVNVPIMVVVTYALSGFLAALGGFMVLGFTQNVFLNLGDRFLFPSVAAVVVGGTVLAGGRGSYWGTMAGALVLTLITSLLTAVQLPESIRQIVLGTTLLVLISVYGREEALRQ